MKKLLLTAAVLLVSTTFAEARSCSDYKSICLSKGSKKCEGAWKQCMKTGTYVGPDSGTNHGQADKR
ncbi:hypothetical protein ABIA94_009175 [Bradyrhizobium sp. LA7.1]